MQKTPFAGLTRLNPNESLSTDGFSFQDQNLALIDYFIELALTHRHDGAPALGDPIAAPSAAVETSGGSIGPDITLHIGYTLIDSKGGETLLSDTDVVSTEPPFDAPASAPLLEVEYGTGAILIGTYYYGITLLDAGGGESPMSPWAAIERLPGDASAQINISGLTEDFVATGAVAWRLYRSKVGSHFDLLAEGTVDTYTDDGSVPVDCDVHPPSDFQNTTNAANKVVVEVPVSEMGDAVSFNLYASIDGAFNGSCLVGNFDTGIAGTDIDILTLGFLRGSPPDVSTSKAGLSQIDPDTEILDWHWKRPVDTFAELPNGVAGDVRLVLQSSATFGVLHGSATAPEDWYQLDGQGGAGSLTVTGINPSDPPNLWGVEGVTFLRVLDQYAADSAVLDEGGGSAAIVLPPDMLRPFSQGIAFAGSASTDLDTYTELPDPFVISIDLGGQPAEVDVWFRCEAYALGSGSVKLSLQLDDAIVDSPADLPIETDDGLILDPSPTTVWLAGADPGWWGNEALPHGWAKAPDGVVVASTVRQRPITIPTNGTFFLAVKFRSEVLGEEVVVENPELFIGVRPT